MSEMAQNIIVLTIVGGCVGYVAFQLFSTLAGGASRAGGCCADGCVQTQAGRDDTSDLALTTKGVAFVSSDSLADRARQLKAKSSL